MPLWRPGLTQLPSLLRELISLLREQNSLQRELIQFHTRRAAQTPLSPAPGVLLTPPPRPTRKYTADDVFVASRDNRERQILVEQASQTLPWRHPFETLADLETNYPLLTSLKAHPSAAAPAPNPPTSDPTKA